MVHLREQQWDLALQEEHRHLRIRDLERVLLLEVIHQIEAIPLHLDQLHLREVTRQVELRHREQEVILQVELLRQDREVILRVEVLQVEVALLQEVVHLLQGAQGEAAEVLRVHLEEEEDKTTPINF